MSEVSAVPPLHLLDSLQPMSPHSPHLPGDTILQPTQPGQVQQPENEQTFTLNLPAIPPPDPTTTHMSTPPIQSTPEHDISPTTPLPQFHEQVFWDSWSTQQANNLECLHRQTQCIGSLANHVPRLCRINSLQNTELTRMSNMRVDNNRMLDTYQRIMDENQRLHQAYLHILTATQNTQKSMVCIMETHTTATRDLNVTLTTLTQHLTHQFEQTSTSSTGRTHLVSPVTSPPRRSVRT
ncbi:uncharacterized protein LOC134886538 [Pseudophryne corroboree]|uniref:uncharacterized protein LOC134886538 n=1 Tax=Pseudophryne corroboree TaxID=495146 RepID=UPI003081E02F